MIDARRGVSLLLRPGGLLRNVVYNGWGLGFQIATGLITVPLLVHGLGAASYGTWIVIGSLTDYFGLLDLGIRGAVGRQVAIYDAVQERTGLAALLSTALAVLGGVGLIGLVGIVASSALLAHMPGIDADQLSVATVATCIVAVNFAVALPLNVFDATLWGLERFDVLNVVDIAIGLARLVVTAMLLYSGFGLVSLAWTTLTLTVLTGALKAGLSWRFLPALRLLPVRPRRTMAAGLFRYGAWNLIGTIGLRLRQISAPMLIATLMGVASVTPFSIVTRLVAYANLLVQTGTGVLLPFASRLDACRGGRRRQQELLICGGRVCCLLALFVAAWLVLLGRGLLTLWMGSATAAYTPVLIVLMIGEIVPLSQLVTQVVLQAMARHQRMAVWSVVDAVTGLALGAALIGPAGLGGLAIGVAVSGAVLRGIAILVYGCRVTGVSLSDYLRQSVVPAMKAASIPVIWLLVMVVAVPPLRGAILFCYGLAFTGAFIYAASPAVRALSVHFDTRGHELQVVER